MDRRTRSGPVPFGRRIDGNGGRRKLTRDPLRRSAKATSDGRTHHVTLKDISAFGAQIVGMEGAEVGREILISAPPFVLFGAVAWTKPNSCGVVFDQSLADREVMELRISRTPNAL